MLWNLRHRWLLGGRFTLNCYNHSTQLLISRLGEVDPETILSHERVAQGDPLSMVLYGLSLSVLVEHIRTELPVFI